jgi:EmrB/QacA subfamily drug resistance transporter
VTGVGHSRGAHATLDDRRWTILVAMSLATAVTEFDETVMAVALPSIDAAFNASLASVQWVVLAYVLAFAAVLIPAGRVADVVGARRVFLVGAAVFAAGSAACALAPGVGWLIGARVLQGLGAAILTPASFAIVVSAFRPGERGRALGLWTAAVAVGAAVGPLGGGVLIEVLGWRAIFVMSVPIALAAIAIVAVAVPAGTRSEARGPAPLSVALLVVGLALVLVGLGEGAGESVVPGGFVALVAGVVALVALALYDARDDHPLLNLALFRIRSYLGVNAVMFVAATAWLAMLLLQGIYLQTVRGMSALEAGLALMPLTGAAVISAPLAGHYAERVGARVLIVAGMGFLALSLGLLALVDQGTAYWPGLLIPYTLNGIGWGMLQTPIDTDAVRSVGEPRAGFVAGFLGMTYQLGAALGIAVATVGVQALGAARLDDLLLRDGITTTALQRAGLTQGQVEGKLGTREVLAELPGLSAAQADRVAGALSQSFVHALTTTMALSAAVVAAGAVLALALIGRASVRPFPRRLRDA